MGRHNHSQVRGKRSGLEILRGGRAARRVFVFFDTCTTKQNAQKVTFTPTAKGHKRMINIKISCVKPFVIFTVTQENEKRRTHITERAPQWSVHLFPSLLRLGHGPVCFQWHWSNLCLRFVASAGPVRGGGVRGGNFHSSTGNKPLLWSPLSSLPRPSDPSRVSGGRADSTWGDPTFLCIQT